MCCSCVVVVYRVQRGWEGQAHPEFLIQYCTKDNDEKNNNLIDAIVEKA